MALVKHCCIFEFKYGIFKIKDDLFVFMTMTKIIHKISDEVDFMHFQNNKLSVKIILVIDRRGPDGAEFGRFVHLGHTADRLCIHT